MDPRDGAVYGMGSSPSFDARVLAKPFSDRTYRELTSRAADAPLVNRATESAYPTGSTFKPVTAFAALSGGLIDADTTIDDTGNWDLGTQHYQNAGQAQFGTIDVADALKVSSDIFFFRLGAQADDHDDLIQRWAARFGFGRKTGIDLPGESAGLVPDPKWRTAGYRAYRACVGEGAPDRRHLGRPVQVRRDRQAVDAGRQRQPRRRPGRPAGDAAAARGRLQRDRQRRHDRAPPPRHDRPGLKRLPDPRPPRRPAPPHRARPGRSPDRARRASSAPPASPAAPPPTSSRAGRSATASTARPAPPSARRTPTRPGTPASSTTPSGRSSSS